MQLHGGYGYMSEYEVARAWRDARVTKIWAGTNEIMKEIIGRSLGLEEPRGWTMSDALCIYAMYNASLVVYSAGRRRIRAARTQRATSSLRWL